MRKPISTAFAPSSIPGIYSQVETSSDSWRVEIGWDHAVPAPEFVSSPLTTSMTLASEFYDPSNPEPAGVYEAIMPSTETFLGMGLIVVLCFVTAYVWQNQVVPTSRTKLALSKKAGGDVYNYLEELKESDPNAAETSNEHSANMTALDLQTNDDMEAVSSTKTPSDNRAFERWLFTDWLLDNKSARKGGRQKEPALPILKEAKWNSGDNPVLAATLLIMVGVTFTAVTERITLISSSF